MTARTLQEIAQICDASLEGDGELQVEGLATLAEAGPRQVSFLANPRYRALLESTRACAVLIGPDMHTARADIALLRCANPNRSWTALIRAFTPAEPRPSPGLHPSAVVSPDAIVDASASVGAHCSLGPGARVGARCVLLPGAVVGRGAELGDDSELGAHAVLYPRVRVGRHCLIHAGTVIGADGFGFEPTPAGWEKIPQCGTVVIEDDVEIGANCTIDRARFGATRIGRGAKLDNLVHVGHNVQIGPGALLIAQVGVAGSARIGPGAILAGQAGVNGHVEIGERARVAGGSGVTADVPAGADYMGYPARPRMEWLRTMARLARGEALAQRVKDLERRLARSERVRGTPRKEGN